MDGRGGRGMRGVSGISLLTMCRELYTFFIQIFIFFLKVELNLNILILAWNMVHIYLTPCINISEFYQSFGNFYSGFFFLSDLQ